MSEPKTSTFTIHHDRCDPSKWAAPDILAFADFIKYGSLQHAAHLSRLGVQLVLSEHLEPKGGSIEHLGWAEPGNLNDFGPLDEIADDEDVTEVVPVYRGQSVFAARYGIGDGDGNLEGYEYEIKDTREEADAFIIALQKEGRAA